jgi:hypothetical protein
MWGGIIGLIGLGYDHSDCRREVVVVERRLLLKEEAPSGGYGTTERHQESVPLRYQEAAVTGFRWKCQNRKESRGRRNDTAMQRGVRSRPYQTVVAAFDTAAHRVALAPLCIPYSYIRSPVLRDRDRPVSLAPNRPLAGPESNRKFGRSKRNSSRERSSAPDGRPAGVSPLRSSLFFFRIGGFEAFGEPGVDRRQQIAGFARPPRSHISRA